MGWFQRYGIPGACFLGLATLWAMALCYNKVAPIVFNKDIIAALVAIFVGSFLPIGYLVCISQQTIYLICPFIGIHVSAARKAGFNLKLEDHFWTRLGQPSQWKLEWNLASRTVIRVAEAAGPESRYIPKHTFIQAWVQKRMDILAINASLIYAAILAPLIVWLFSWVSGLGLCRSERWVNIATTTTGILVIIALLSYMVTRCQVVNVIAGHMKILDDYMQRLEEHPRLVREWLGLPEE